MRIESVYGLSVTKIGWGEGAAPLRSYGSERFLVTFLWL